MAVRNNPRGTTEVTAQALFESKLHPPTARRVAVSRKALVAQLAGSPDVPIASVVAPAGYGKTTLLAEWANSGQARVAWLSIDRHDNDLSQFVSYTAAALDRVEPIDPDMLRPSARRRSVAAAASHVAAAMAGMSEPVTLVLDHVEALQNRECLDTIAELALHLPPGARLALATRVDPPLPIPRLRARGEIVEIGVGDLAMDELAARQLLAEAGVELSDGDLAKVIARAEGWPVGLYLAALAVKAGAPRDAAGIAFSGDDRIIAEYLRSEVLDHLSTEEVQFLTRTAVLDRMSGQLCDAVLDATGSAEVLDSLAHANMLLVGLDRQGEWYRYHHLFRDLLRAELARREPDLIAALHVRASDWCAENGLAEMAIDHALGGSDPARMNALLLLHAQHLYAVGRAESLRRWMAWLEERGFVDQYPALAILGAILFSASAHVGDVERWAAAAEYPSRTLRLPSGGTPAQRATPDRVLPDGSTLAAWLAVLRLVLCRDGLDAMLRDARIAMEGLAAGSPYRAAAVGFESFAYLAAGDVERADALFARAYALGVDMLRLPAAAISAGMRGLIAARRDDWPAADDRCHEALDLIETWGLVDYAESAPGFVLAARLAARRGDDAAENEYLRRVERLRPLLTYGRPHSSLATLIELARVYADLGDTAGAREAVRQAREILLQRPDVGTFGSEVDAVATRLDGMQTGRVGVSSLTTAELRLVPYLPTHLTFREIAQRLHVSHNTAKTQAISVYQKLGVSSRGAAVERLQALGLLEA